MSSIVQKGEPRCLRMVVCNVLQDLRGGKNHSQLCRSWRVSWRREHLNETLKDDCQKQCISNLSTHQNHLENLLKHRLFMKTSRAAYSVDPE